MSADDLRAALRHAIDEAQDDLENQRSTLEIATALAREAVHCHCAGLEPMAHYLITRAATLHESFLPLTEALAVPGWILQANIGEALA